MAFNQGCRGLIPGKELNTQYLFYFLYANVELLNALGTGTTFKELSAGALAKVEMPVPPLAEQERIVVALDEAFKAIATVMASTKLASERIEELTFNSTRNIFDQFGDNLSPLGSLCDNLDGRRQPVTKKDRQAGPVPYYGASGVVDHVAKAIFNEPLLLVSEDGANLLARTYPIAFSINGPAWVNNHAHVLRFKTEPLRRLTEYYLNSIPLHDFVSGMAQPKLNQAALNRIPIPCPEEPAQQSAVRQLDEIFQEAALLRQQFLRKLTLLTELKSVMLARAFSGELTAAAETPLTAAPANDNDFTTPEQVANVIAFAQRQHITQWQQLTFGHKKAQKALQFIEAVGGVELGRRPDKDAAGPNDFQHMLSAERWAKANGFFEFVKEGERYTFRKLAKYAERMRAADAALAPIKDRLERATALVVELNSTKAEVLATVHAAWNNLILDDEDPTEEAIVRAAREEWHPDKLLIPVSEFRQAIREIRRLGIVPDGSAKRVGEPRLL